MAAIGKGLAIFWLLIYLFYNSLWAGVLFSPGLLLFYKKWKKDCLRKKEHEFRLQFGEALKTFMTALNVGYSVENAIRTIPKEMKLLLGENAIIIREFSYIIRQLDMNITVEKAFLEFAERVNIEELYNFATVFSILKRSGGDMIQALKNTIGKICTAMEVQREIETMIAAKRMEFKVMTVIPLGIIVYMKISFPEFMSVLYRSIAGSFVMTGCLFSYVGAWYLGEKILEIEV